LSKSEYIIFLTDCNHYIRFFGFGKIQRSHYCTHVLAKFAGDLWDVVDKLHKLLFTYWHGAVKLRAQKKIVVRPTL